MQGKDCNVEKNEFKCGGFFIRPIGYMLNKKGDRVDGHQHLTDHMTIVLNGSIRVRSKFPDGKRLEKDFVAGTKNNFFLTRKNNEHEQVALEDNTMVWCMFAEQETNGATSCPEIEGWEEDAHVY